MQFSSVVDLEAKLLEGGDDDDFENADKKAGCCLCCGGPDKSEADEDEDILSEEEGMVEHTEDAPDLKDFTEENFSELQTIGYGYEMGLSNRYSGDDREKVDMEERPLRGSIANTCFIYADGYRGTGFILNWVV